MQILGRIPEPLAYLTGTSEGRRGHARGRSLSCDDTGSQRKLEVEVDSVLHRIGGETINRLGASPQMRDSLDIGVTCRRVPAGTQPITDPRSEERRVGKECRSR